MIDGIRNRQGTKTDKLTLNGTLLDVDNVEIKKMLEGLSNKLAFTMKDG